MDGCVDQYHVLLAETVPDEVISALLEGVRPHRPELDGTVLVGPVGTSDQLVGMLGQLALLGYTVLEVRRVRAR